MSSLATFRAMLGGCATFRAIVGVENANDALPFIFPWAVGAAEEAAKPFALLGRDGGDTSELLAVGLSASKGTIRFEIVIAMGDSEGTGVVDEERSEFAIVEGYAERIRVELMAQVEDGGALHLRDVEIDISASTSEPRNRYWILGGRASWPGILG